MCFTLIAGSGCTRSSAPSAPLPELSALEALPDQVTAVAWGPAEVVVWSHELRFIPPVVSLMESMVIELNSLGVPRDRLEQITVGLDLKASPVEWILLLDGQWSAREVVEGKRVLHGDDARVDVAGEMAVNIREELLFSSAGPRRIAVGSPALVRSCVEGLRSGGGTVAARVQEIAASLPEAPLRVAVLNRLHHLPGVERAAMVVRREPEVWLEARVDCVGIAGCERFQEALFGFVQASRAAVSPPSPEALRFFTGLRFEPDGESGRLVLDPVQL